MRPIPARAALAVAVLTAGMLFGCSGGPTPPTRPPLPRPTFRLLVVTDLKGYLAPCGCQTRPLGGIDKMAAAIARARADHVPTLLLSAGDLLFDGVAHAGVGADEAATQELWKAETLAQILAQLELAAATPGVHDFALGAEAFSTSSARLRDRVLASGVQVSGSTAPFGSHLVRDVGGTKVGIVGVTDLRGPAGALPAGVSAEGTPLERARTAVTEVRAGGARVVVALVNGSRRTSRDVARLPGVDFVVMGGLDDAEVAPPPTAGQAVLLHAARQGHGVLVVDVFAPSGAASAWADVGDWSARVERERLDRRITELRTRIAAWERDRAVDRAALAEQRTRLTGLERERAALDAPRALRGRGFAARWEELGPEARGDTSVARVVARYDARVNDHNRRVFANVRAPEPAPGQPHYVGSERCRSCHGEAFAQWRSTPHGRAYATLASRNKQFNLSCVGCHVTGYNQPGGSTVAHVEGLIDVGCENCHGPGSIHAEDPAREPETAIRAVPEGVCVRCHNPEHSDRFSYQPYLQILLGPGHGRPMPDGRLVTGQRRGGT